MKHTPRRQRARDMTSHGHVGRAVITIQRDAIVRFLLLNLKSGVVMRRGKQSAADHRVEARRGIAPRDVYTLALCLVVVPFHCNAMGSILGGDAEHGWADPWPDVLQPDQANAGHADA